MKHYKRQEWRKFREELIELDGCACCRCGRGPATGIVLQVHHKLYVSGKMPWEYAYSDCETLCKGCHSSEHGITRPTDGWVCHGVDDLGDLEGTCELCERELRYVFFVQHEKWDSMEVGETCCDHLTGKTEASEHMKLKGRELRFLNSPRWKCDDRRRLSIKQNSIVICVENTVGGFRIIVNNT